MGKQKRDYSFYRYVIMHCLNYAPRMPLSTMDLPKIKTLRSMQYAINFIRSEYYAWFLSLVSKIPRDDWTPNKLMKHFRCLRISNDEYGTEEHYQDFLISCALVVQFVHFTVMELQCLEYIDVGADCLERLFNKKYRGEFTRTLSWDGFERYCDATLRRKRKFFRYAAALRKSGQCLQKFFRGNIFQFWSLKRINCLKRFTRKMEHEVGRGVRMMFLPEFCDRLKRMMGTFNYPAIRGLYQSRDFVSRYPDCLKDKCGFCVGCVLTVSYQEVKSEELKILHEILKSAGGSKNEGCDSSKETSFLQVDDNNLERNLDSSKNIYLPKVEDKVPMNLERKDDTSKVEIGFPIGSHQDSIKTGRTEDFLDTLSDESLLSSSVTKILKNIFAFGVIALKSGLAYWLTILKDALKSSLVKLLFYILRVFKNILFQKKVSPPKSDPASKEHASTLDKDSTGSKQNLQIILDPVSADHLSKGGLSTETYETPKTFNPISQEHATTEIINSTEIKGRPLSIDSASEKLTSTRIVDSGEIKGRPLSIDSASEDRSSTRIVDSVEIEGRPLSIDSASEIREELGTKRLLSGFELLDEFTLLGDGDEDPYGLNEPLRVEMALDSVQTSLDWTHGTLALKRIFNLRYIPNRQLLSACYSCEKECKLSFLESLEKYRIEFGVVERPVSNRKSR